MKLDGLTALVTGSTGSLGSAMTLALADAGCNCVCHYHTNRARADNLADQIRAKGRKALAIQADLTQPHEISELVTQAHTLGPLRILINAAAVFAREPLGCVTFDTARRTLDTNLIAPILTARDFTRAIAEETKDTPVPAAKIVNIVDVAGLRPWAEYAIYSASKAGLIAATKSLARELLPAVTVNAVAPGLVTWPEGFSEQEKARQLKYVPMKRTARPDEITDAVLFLLKNDYMTGHVLTVDGGRSI
ncbi:MAG TPA: SDR family oxidoreductase [Anaerohalosphaeraceae bacterium]|jgi:pteridine reductase|nr:SDR family oxidoreductase [Anaerohalosphaeraceae bacterium]HRT51835.1 SDR family oxidoreductase [Anaerohalosphaeraceae bacterium]HRT87853.1 SDR family oxidoreductase [Anaerohalosphaeraceae bacterium]